MLYTIQNNYSAPKDLNEKKTIDYPGIWFTDK